MADVSAIFGLLFIVSLAFPGLLTTLWLLFPATVERARVRLDKTPWRCFWLGGILLALTLIPSVILMALPWGPAKFAGWAVITLMLAFASLGAAGLALKMSEHLARQSNGALASAGAFVRGAVALELAAAFPVIGWLILVPLAAVVSLGAAAFAVLHWMPVARPTAATLSETAIQQAS
jgi:hypothetical protein